jgi:hypothetical protein
MSKTIRSFILYAAPVFVGGLNLFHPTHFDHNAVYDGLHAITGWWITLHVLNLFGFAALGLSAYLLLLERHGIAVNVAKTALLIFVPAYAGFDSIIGIGTGVLIRYGSSIPAGAAEALKATVQAFWNNNVAMMLAIIGSVAWNIAMGAAAISFAGSRRGIAIALAVIAGPFTEWGYASGAYGTLPWWIGVAILGLVSLILIRPALPYTLLVLASILFGTSHATPFGPLGMLCFFAAVVLVEWRPLSLHVREMAASRT